MSQIVLGWVHIYANWMRVFPHPISMTRDCDRLSMELVHTAPGWPWSALEMGPVLFWLHFRSKFGKNSDLIHA